MSGITLLKFTSSLTWNQPIYIYTHITYIYSKHSKGLVALKEYTLWELCKRDYALQSLLRIVNFNSIYVFMELCCLLNHIILIFSICMIINLFAFVIDTWVLLHNSGISTFAVTQWASSSLFDFSFPSQKTYYSTGVFNENIPDLNALFLIVVIIKLLK